MRVGVDGKALLPPRAGVARYLEGLLGACAGLDHAAIDVAVVSPDRPRRTMPWVLWDLQRATGQGFDVFHFPFYYPCLWPRCPATVALHDVLVLERPEWFPRGRANTMRVLIPAGARRAAAILTGSRSVAEAIAQRCRVPRERIHLTGYGVDRNRFAPPSPKTVALSRTRFGLARPYLLQLGLLERSPRGRVATRKAYEHLDFEIPKGKQDKLL